MFFVVLPGKLLALILIQTVLNQLMLGDFIDLGAFAIVVVIEWAAFRYIRNKLQRR